MTSELNALMSLLENTKSKKESAKILERVRQLASEDANRSTSYTFDA